MCERVCVVVTEIISDPGYVDKVRVEEVGDKLHVSWNKDSVTNIHCLSNFNVTVVKDDSSSGSMMMGHHQLVGANVSETGFAYTPCTTYNISVTSVGIAKSADFLKADAKYTSRMSKECDGTRSFSVFCST